MLCSCCSPAKSNKILEFESGGGIGIGCGRNNEQKITVGRDAKMVAVVGNQRIAKGIKASGNRLAAKITASFWKMHYANQCRLAKLRVNHVLRILLRLGGHVLAQPQLAGGHAVIEQNAISLSFKCLANGVRNTRVGQRPQVLDLAILGGADQRKHQDADH